MCSKVEIVMSVMNRQSAKVTIFGVYIGMKIDQEVQDFFASCSLLHITLLHQWRGLAEPEASRPAYPFKCKQYEASIKDISFNLIKNVTKSASKLVPIS